METKLIAGTIKSRYPLEIIEVIEAYGQTSIKVKKERIKEIMGFLHDTANLNFDYLEDLCGVDYLGKKEPRFEVVYHLFSMKHRHMIRIKAGVSDEDCSIDSVEGIWKGAEWHERECYDMFGIKFNGHPDLRRILMPEDWDGHPLRKDYQLESDLGDKEWQGLKEVIETAERNRKYEVR